MKKSIKIALIAILSLLVMFAFAGCNDTSEIAGTYEMTSVQGTVNGVSISTSSYEYFRIIIDDKGNGTVQSKGAGAGAVSYEAKGTVTYSNGVIKMTTKNGFSSVTEEYQYADGVITYVFSNEQMNFTLVLTRVEE